MDAFYSLLMLDSEKKHIDTSSICSAKNPARAVAKPKARCLRDMMMTLDLEDINIYNNEQNTINGWSRRVAPAILNFNRNERILANSQ